LEIRSNSRYRKYKESAHITCLNQSCKRSGFGNFPRLDLVLLATRLPTAGKISTIWQIRRGFLW
jgi:hypothetical protein